MTLTGKIKSTEVDTIEISITAEVDETEVLFTKLKKLLKDALVDLRKSFHADNDYDSSGIVSMDADIEVLEKLLKSSTLPSITGILTK